jgi:hypothetical protein
LSGFGACWNGLFNIGTTAYFKLNKPQKANKDFHMLKASYYHHSNGQDQPLLKDSLKNPILIKGAPYVYKPAHVVNNYNGDFYTNYIKFGYINIRTQKIDSNERHLYSKFMAGITRKLSCLLNMEESNRLTYHYRYERMIKWGLDLEAHPNLLAEKEWNSQFWSANFALKNRYGYLRLNGLFDLIDITESKDEINGFTTEVRQSELYRLQVRSSVILNSLSELVNYRWYKRVNIDCSFHTRFAYSKNTSIYIRAGFYGQDPYNVYFEDSFGFLELGLSAGNLFYKRKSKKLPDEVYLRNIGHYN